MTNKVIFFLILILFAFKIAAVFFTQFTLYGDEAQYWLWSQSPDLGYFSKPPLLAWFLSGYIYVFGDSFFSLKNFPTIIYFFISFAIYVFCLRLSLPKRDAIFCAISFLVIPAVSLSSFLISTDLLLLLFWTLTITKLLDVRNSASILNFFLLGIFLGLAFLAKYAAVYFLLSLLFLLILDKKTRTTLKSNLVGLVVFFISFILVLLPNIYWNFSNDWVTFVHTSDNANLQNLSLNFYEPINFLSSQILMVGPILFLSFIFLFKYFIFDFQNKFLLIFSLPIVFIVLVESFLVRANANWAAPALISIFILLFRLVNNKKPFFIKINFIVNYLIAVLLFFFVLISSNNKIFDRIKGVKIFAEEISEIIDKEDLVISDRILFSNISYELRDKPNNLFMPYQNETRITNHFQISSPFKKNVNKKFFLIGDLSDISYLSNKHEGHLIKEFVVPFNSTILRLYEVNIK